MNFLTQYSLLLIILLCLALSHSDNTSLVYKTCDGHQTFLIPSTKSHTQALSSLFQELISRSSKFKFFKTSEGSDDGQAAVSGLFQCREDLTNEACENCIRALPLPDISSTLCEGAARARVQLQGCYVRYEPDGPTWKHYESALLHKACGEPSEGNASEFEQMRDGAFAALEMEMENNNNGFCKTEYQLVQATAQCEGEIEACDCGECVNKAVLIAQDECGSAFSGEVYMDKCFLSYAYYPQGIPGGSLNPGEGESKDNNGSINGKTVAIVLGGAAALCFGLIFVMVIKSCTKKYDD